MKRKVFALLAMIAVFGLAMAAYAYTKTNDTGKAKAACCSKSDSCPMKAKGHDSKAEHAGKSCPMNKHESGKATAEGHECCCCCGDACPMKKEGAATATAVSASEEGKGCCDNCDCCSGKHEKAV